MTVLSSILDNPVLGLQVSDHPVQSFFLAVAAITIIYQTIITTYNLFFHPLKTFPGPLSARASKVPLLWHMVLGRTHIWHQRLHEKYGPVVRTDPNTLSFIDGRAWREIYTQRKGGNTEFIKDPLAYGDPPNGVPSILTAKPDDHSRFRKVFSHAFSEKALKEQEPHFAKYIKVLVHKMMDIFGEGDPTAKVDMVSYLNFTTFDIMGDLTFGEPLGLLEKSDYTPWVATIFAALKFATYVRAVRNWPTISNFLGHIIPKRLKLLRDNHFKYSSNRVDARLERKAERPDIWGLVLKQEGGSKSLSLEEMHSNGALFMGAGTETTATELSGLMYYLSTNRDKLARLTAELRGAFSTSDEISMDRLVQLPYLNACIEEGLRVYPPVPIGLPRVVPAGGATLAGTYIPGLTRVSVTQWSAYRSPLNFAQPNSFLPERWLPASFPESAPFVNDDKSCFQPFSIGPRNCLGQSMAYHEMRLVLATVLWHFDPELCAESKNWPDQRVFALWEKKPLIMKLKVVNR